MLNSTILRVLTAFAMIALAIGAYSAFTESRPGMALLLALGAIAAAIPVFLEPR